MRVLIIYIYIYLHTHTHHGVTASIDLGVFIIETSRSHSDTPYSVGLLWATDQPHAETSTWQHTTLTRDRYPWPWRDSNAQSQERAAADPRLRRRDHWDRPIINITTRKTLCWWAFPYYVYVSLYEDRNISYTCSNTHLDRVNYRSKRR